MIYNFLKTIICGLFKQRSRVIPYSEEVFAPLQQRRVRIGRYVRIHVVVSQPRRSGFGCLCQRRFGLHYRLFDVRFVIIYQNRTSIELLEYTQITHTV